MRARNMTDPVLNATTWHLIKNKQKNIRVTSRSLLTLTTPGVLCPLTMTVTLGHMAHAIVRLGKKTRVNLNEKLCNVNNKYNPTNDFQILVAY